MCTSISVLVSDIVEMYYAHPLISYPSTSEMMASQSPVSRRISKSSGCNDVLLTVLISLYGALHVAAAGLALFLIQVNCTERPETRINVFLFQTEESDNMIEKVELSVFGFVGFLSSSSALAGIWLKYRHCLLPLIIFLIFTTIFDCISVFASLTAGEEEREGRIARNYLPLLTSRAALWAAVFKILLSLFLLERLVHNYRRNVKIRGGRSPVRRKEDLNSPASP